MYDYANESADKREPAECKELLHLADWQKHGSNKRGNSGNDYKTPSKKLSSSKCGNRCWMFLVSCVKNLENVRTK